MRRRWLEVHLGVSPSAALSLSLKLPLPAGEGGGWRSLCSLRPHSGAEGALWRYTPLGSPSPYPSTSGGRMTHSVICRHDACKGMVMAARRDSDCRLCLCACDFVVSTKKPDKIVQFLRFMQCVAPWRLAALCCARSPMHQVWATWPHALGGRKRRRCGHHVRAVITAPHGLLLQGT